MKNEEKMDFSAKEIAKTLVCFRSFVIKICKKNVDFEAIENFIYQYEESFEEKNKRTHGTYKNRVKYVPGVVK